MSRAMLNSKHSPTHSMICWQFAVTTPLLLLISSSSLHRLITFLCFVPAPPGDGFFITRDPTDLGPNRTAMNLKPIALSAVSGGDLSDNLSYEVAANYGNFQQTTLDANRVITDPVLRSH